MMFIGVNNSFLIASEKYTIKFKNKVALTDTKYISRNIIGTDKIIEYSFLKGLPNDEILIDTIAVYSVLLNPDRDGGDERKFYVYVALDKERKNKYVVVDSNNNLDFSDDKQYVFSMKDYSLDWEEKCIKSSEVEVNFVSCDKNEEKPLKISLLLSPFMSFFDEKYYSSKEEYFLNVVFLTNQYATGNIEINARKYIVNSSSSKLDTFEKKILKEDSNFYFFQENDTIFPLSYCVGDTVSLDGALFYLQKSDENHLYLESSGFSSDSCFVGSKIPCLYAKSLYGNKVIYLNDLMKDKYVLFDFWGSWCRPCVASFPKLNMFYEKIKNKKEFMIIGVALENEKDLDKTKNILKEKKIPWLNVWSDWSDRRYPSSIHGKLKIEHYPTYIMVDKSGTIIYRSSGPLNTNLEELFYNIIDKIE